MAVPGQLFGRVTPVCGGVLSKLAYGKYNTKVSLSLAKPSHEAATKVADLLRKKTNGSENPIHVRFVNAEQVSICYNQLDGFDLSDSLSFPLFRKIKSATYQHITETQISAVKSNYGSVLRNKLWLNKFKYKTKIDVQGYLSNTKKSEIVNHFSSIFSSDPLMVRAFQRDGFDDFGESGFDANDRYGFNYGKKGADTDIRFTDSDNIMIYSSNSSVGVMLSMLLDASTGISLEMEEAILPSEI